MGRGIPARPFHPLVLPAVLALTAWILMDLEPLAASTSGLDASVLEPLAASTSGADATALDPPAGASADGPAPSARPAARAPAPPVRPADGEIAPPDEALLQAYLPKEDLGVPRFRREHPGADGSGILVAILDTGVDLNHPGLARTPDGQRKILDVFDATDNGLVELPVEIAPADSLVPGLTGRMLRLGEFRGEGGRVRLGRLAAREVFPPGLNRRLRDARREDRQRVIDVWEKEIAAAEAARARGGAEAESIAARRDPAAAYRRARLEADRAYRDPGPSFDVAAARRNGSWEVRLDLDEDGDLGEERSLRPFRENGDFVTFPAPATFSAALAWIAEDGARCSIFFDEGGHGTHVAGIVGAWYAPDDPLNGIAPGAQFVAVRIGNGRFGGSTSHNSIAKGITWAVERGAMIANISFGGSSYFGDGDEILSRYLDEVVQNHGMFITLSAGNEGPGLSTVGSPGTARRVFTLGAAISPLTMMASYGGLARPLAGSGVRMFHFSSRGPLTNGSPGIDFISPGAAVSPLPTWHLTRNENWNGTSMAAPQAAGCLALLLSAARHDGTPVSPPRVDRALRATARPLPGVPFVEQGAGLIALSEAYEALRGLARSFPVEGIADRSGSAAPAAGAAGEASVVRAAAAASEPPRELPAEALPAKVLPGEAPRGAISNPAAPSEPPADSTLVPGIGVPATRDPVTFWKLSVDNATGAGEGLYERNEENTAPYWKSWHIAPDLPEKGANSLRARFHRVVRLRSDAPWLEAPPQVSVPASGTWIRVLVDPARMQPGLNTARIRVSTVAAADARGGMYDASDAPGTETELTATVIRPERVGPPDWRWRGTFDLPPGERRAVFLRVPEGATRMTVRARETRADPAATYSLAATALDLLLPPSALRDARGFDLARDGEAVFHQRVEPGTTVELAVFARWVNPTPGRLELTAEFDGVTGPAGLGSSARLWGEQDEEARWGVAALQALPGQDGTILPLRSLLRPVAARVEAQIENRLEPLKVEWTVGPDTLHPATLEGGRDPLLLLGRGLVRLDRGESITVDLHAGPTFEDFLDDAFCRLYTPAGGLAGAASLSSGPFRLTAPEDGPPSGWYHLEFSVFAIGRDLVRDTRFLSPEVRRDGRSGRITPYPDPVHGRAADGDSSWTFHLLPGAAAPVYLRVTGLPEGGLWSGTVRVRDETDAPPLLVTSLQIDARDPSPEAEASLDRTVEVLEQPARALLTAPPGAPEPAIRAALADLDRADALEQAWKGDSFEGSDRWWERLFLRTDLRLRHLLEVERDRLEGEREREARDRARKRGGGAVADPYRDLGAAALGDQRTWDARVEQARRETGRQLEEAGRRLRGELREPAARRLAGRRHLRQAKLAWCDGDLSAAQRELDRARSFDFGGESPHRVEAELLLHARRPLEALAPLREARARDPWNPLLAGREIGVYLDLGWTDLADEALAAWSDRFPRDPAGLAGLAQRRAETAPAEEVR